MRWALSLLVILASPGLAAAADSFDDPFVFNKALGAGVNLGNALDAPTEGAWGVTLKAQYFSAIRDAGFQSVRIPVRWSAHASKQAPYELDADFAKRVDWAIDQALANRLLVVLNVHHYDEFHGDPAGHADRLVGLWKQLAERYQKRGDQVCFELLNEPTDKVPADLWNALIVRLLAEVRKTNARRVVVVGPNRWNNLHALESLKLPESDQRLIVTFHYYDPFPFTHQGAEWAPGADKWLGTKWSGSAKELEDLRRDFDKAAQWAKKANRPLYVGEFGAYSKADLDSRVAWTKAVVAEAKRHGMSFAYWEFCAGFGAYDPTTEQWRTPLKNALLGGP